MWKNGKKREASYSIQPTSSAAQSWELFDPDNYEVTVINRENDGFLINLSFSS
jgi:hypothetical protein